MRLKKGITMGNKNGHIRTISRMERLLSEYGKLDTVQIMEGLMVQKNKSGKAYHSCPTMQQLANLLSGNKQFSACGHSAAYGTMGYSYDVIVWELKGSDEDEDTAVS